jgi:hypothetical protein
MNRTLLGAALLVAVAALLLTQAKARTLTTLFSFDGKDGAFPVANLLAIAPVTSLARLLRDPTPLKAWCSS